VGKTNLHVHNSNIAIIQGFKEYCALMFFKGALLTDPNGILETPVRTRRRLARSGSPVLGKYPRWNPSLKPIFGKPLQWKKPG